MFSVVIGGSGSGKSEFAEALAMKREPGEKIYVATMEPYDEESFRRIERHRQMRSTKRFRTVECFRHLEQVEAAGQDTVLLECMSNLVANEMFHPEGRGERTAEAVAAGIRQLREHCGNLVVVTNDVFGDGEIYAEGSQKYLEILGEVNRRMGQMADEVYRVVCGIAVQVK